MSIDDRRDLRQFIHDFQQLLVEVTDGTRHPGLLPDDDRRTELRQAVEGLAHVFNDVHEAIVPEIETSPARPDTMSLEDADLLGDSRERKIDGWRRAVRYFQRWATRKALGRPLRWANMILGSLAKVIPPAEALKELKEYAENLIADAEEDAAESESRA